MPVRRLTSGDEAAADAACRAFGSEGELDVSRFLGRDDVHLFVAEDEGGVAGWIYGQELLHPDGEVTMLLYALDVAERAQRRGHGGALVTAFVDHARLRGCSEVWVLTEPGNEAALATYAAAGGVREVEDSAMVVWPLIPGHQPP